KILRHGTEKPRPVSDFRPDVPAEVQAVLDRLMAKHPGDRFQAPAELAEALLPYAVSGPTPWAPPPAPAPEPDDALATPGDDLGDDGDLPGDGSDGELAAPGATDQAALG